jgi:Tripartite tricarboxylate transporter family receptor
MPLAGPATRIVDLKNRRVGLPGIPVIAEFVPEYDSSQWHGLSAPKQTPAEIVGKLDREITIENNTSGSRVGPQAASHFAFQAAQPFKNNRAHCFARATISS